MPAFRQADSERRIAPLRAVFVPARADVSSERKYDPKSGTLGVGIGWVAGVSQCRRAARTTSVGRIKRRFADKRPTPRKRVPSIDSTVRVTRPLRRAAPTPPAMSPATRRSIMTRTRKLATRSDRGHIKAPVDTFSTGFVEPREESYLPVTDDAIIEAALNILAKRITQGSLLGSPQAVKDYLITRLADSEHETFGVMFLTTRHRLIDFVEIFRGTVDGCSVYPREIVKLALAKNASALLLCHQHPSGVAEPSQADELITGRIKEACDLIGVRVLDHLVVAGRCTVSMAERGLI